MKKVLAMLLAAVMTFSMIGCGGGTTGNDGAADSQGGSGNAAGSQEESGGASDDQGGSGDAANNSGETYKIAVLSFDTSGALYDASCAYLDYLGKALGFEYVYVNGGFSSQEQISTAETYLAQGYKGIILNQDMGAAEAILDLCKDYDAYLGGYWCDFANSIYATGAPNMNVLQNERFVGSAIDGKASTAPVAEAMFDAIVLQDGHTEIGIAVMPVAWYPMQVSTGVTRFMELVDEYNAGDKTETNGVPVTVVQTGTDGDGNPIYYEAVDGTSMSFSSSFFTNNQMTACASLASSSFTYNALIESKADVGLYATGWENTYVDDFGSNGRIKQITVSPVESLIFPIAQIIDRLNGYTYEDVPTGDAVFGKVIDTDQIYITGDAGLAAFQKSLHYTADASDAYFSADDVKQFMLTYNGDRATYAELSQALNNNDMSIEALEAR